MHFYGNSLLSTHFTHGPAIDIESIEIEGPIPATDGPRYAVLHPRYSRASGHQRIDPIGYGLEHFNAVGLWRDVEVAEIASGYSVRKSKEHPIDATGTLPDGTKFDGFFQLRDAIAKREKAFSTGLIENLVSYALGRPNQLSDDDLCADLLIQARKENLTLQAIIQALVASREFQTK